MLIAAVVVAAAAVIAVLAIASIRQGAPEQKPVAIAAVPAPQADSPQCQALTGALPGQLDDYRRAPTADPTPPGATAWQADPGSEAVILRCGLDRPSDFVVGVPLQVVNAVQWFEAKDPTGGRSTWYAVDRPVYVALTLPQGSGPTPIQLISDAIAKTMPAEPIKPAPPR